MNLQGAPAFSPEDYPDAPEELLKRLTEAFDEVYSVLAGMPDIKFRGGLTFTTNASGAGYLDVSMDQMPTDLWVTKLETDAGSVSDPYSQTWTRLNGKVRVLFAGLANSTKYTARVGYA